MIRKLALALAASGVLLSLGACNTVKGLGRDIESVGEAGDRAIDAQGGQAGADRTADRIR